MTDPLEPIFVAADLDMRPEFRRHLRELARTSHATLHAPERREPPGPVDAADAAVVDMVDVVDGPERLDERRAARSRRFLPRLSAAAAIIAVIGALIVLRPSISQAPTDSTPPAECPPTADVLDVVAGARGDTRVALDDDGSTFCVSDVATGESLLVAAEGGTQPSGTAVPTVVRLESLPAAHLYAVDVPAGLPAASVSGVHTTVFSYPARTARRFLVVEPVLSDGSNPPNLLELRASNGMVLATLDPTATSSVNPSDTSAP